VYNPAMKNKNWFTLAGCILLFGSAIFHSSGYFPLVRRMRAAGIGWPFDGLLKACWWILSVDFVGLGVIALLAQRMEHGGRKQGGRIVLLCAAISAVTAGILWSFLGLFIGVYLLGAATVLLLIGGWMQGKREPAS
jgi:hypothetical protein